MQKERGKKRRRREKKSLKIDRSSFHLLKTVSIVELNLIYFSIIFAERFDQMQNLEKKNVK